MNTTPNQTSGGLNGSPLNSSDPARKSTAPPKKRSAIKALLGVLLVLAIALIALLYRSVVMDYVVAHALYTAPTAVQSVATELDLTERGRDIFYASRPVILDSSSSFPCKGGEGNSVILGCYGSQGGLFSDGVIYVLNVQNATLEGVVPVTAAHELLHAAYSRLNFFEKAHVDQMIRAEYQKIKDDPEIKDQMEYYKLAEPGQDINELHSIIGTTVAALDSDLESYYAQYFVNRAEIVSSYEKYSQALHKNDEQIKALEAKLNTESDSLSRDMATYRADVTQLNLDIQSFNARANSGGFSSQSSFTAARNALIIRTNALNTRAEALNERVEAYNEDVKTINGLSAQTEQLYSSLKGVEAPDGV